MHSYRLVCVVRREAVDNLLQQVRLGVTDDHVVQGTGKGGRGPGPQSLPIEVPPGLHVHTQLPLPPSLPPMPPTPPYTTPACSRQALAQDEADRRDIQDWIEHRRNMEVGGEGGGRWGRGRCWGGVEGGGDGRGGAGTGGDGEMLREAEGRWGRGGCRGVVNTSPNETKPNCRSRQTRQIASNNTHALISNTTGPHHHHRHPQPKVPTHPHRYRRRRSCPGRCRRWRPRWPG